MFRPLLSGSCWSWRQSRLLQAARSPSGRPQPYWWLNPVKKILSTSLSLFPLFFLALCQVPRLMKVFAPPASALLRPREAAPI